MLFVVTVPIKGDDVDTVSGCDDDRIPHWLFTQSQQSQQSITVTRCYNITELTYGEFGRYKKLTELILRDNNITNVSDEAFSGTKISRLDLSYNSLTVFPNLSSIAGTLKELNLANNNLIAVNQRHLSELKYLENLDLSSNEYETYMPDFTEVGSLAPSSAKLELKMNGLPMKTTTFCHFHKVTLVGNESSSVPKLNCSGPSRLVDLRSNSRGYTSATDFSTMILPSTVKRFYCAGNDLQMFPDLPSKYRKQLKGLYLRDNHIAVIKAGRMIGYNLTILSLDNNILVQLPNRAMHRTMSLSVATNSHMTIEANALKKSLCNANSMDLVELNLTDSLESASTFPPLADAFCQRKQLLKIYLHGVSMLCSFTKKQEI